MLMTAASTIRGTLLHFILRSRLEVASIDVFSMLVLLRYSALAAVTRAPNRRNKGISGEERWAEAVTSPEPCAQ